MGYVRCALRIELPPSWRDYACGMDIVLMERRMKIAIKEEQLEDKMSEVTVSGKEEAERGRQR